MEIYRDFYGCTASFKEKRYSISYCSGACGYGWEQDTDYLKEVESVVNSLGKNYTASVTVFDRKHGDFIFWKDVLEFKPSIDLLHRADRDFRTKTRNSTERV